jgi:hypothetical protein
MVLALIPAAAVLAVRAYLHRSWLPTILQLWIFGQSREDGLHKSIKENRLEF